jgi:hypothetical protein
MVFSLVDNRLVLDSTGPWVLMAKFGFSTLGTNELVMTICWYNELGDVH